MIDYLSANQLLAHVEMLAQTIGPRPAGWPAEAAARDYIRRVLYEVGYTANEIEELPFRAPDTWGYGLLATTLLALLGNGLGKLGRAGKLLGGATALFSAYHLRQSMRAQRQSLTFLYPKRPTADLIVRIPANHETRQRVVLVGHTDTNKARATFAPSLKRFLPVTATSSLLLLLLNGLAQLAEAAGFKSARTAQRLTAASLTGFLPLLLWDEKGRYVDGANDNATAVACLLGLGAHLKQRPLDHTEVWLAFTGAEEVGGLGLHALIAQYGSVLKDAWCLDIEMVGTHEIAYVTRHGLSPLASWTPDAESLALAQETSARYPELEVTGRPLVITEEIGSLHEYGLRGICLAGVGKDGWLANWHQYSDNFANIVPAGLERAARFALAMMQTLEERSTA